MLTLAAALAVAALAAAGAHAQGGEGQAAPAFSLQRGVESAFPDGIRFTLDYAGNSALTQARVFYRVLGEQATRYEYFEFAPAAAVSATLLVRTDTAARYIPPGAELEWWIETLNAAGVSTGETPQRFTLLDPRFAWERLEGDGVSILHYGGSAALAQRSLEAAQAALADAGALMGVADPGTLRLTLYNNVADMRPALPPRSQVQERTLVTEGISFGDTGVVLLLGANREVEGVAAHETVHFLMRAALGGGARFAPAWLNEGLAEYVNPTPSPGFAALLERRLAADTLIPLTSLTTAPGIPEDTLLMYGQGRSVVAYMVDTYGAEPLQALLRGLRSGMPIDEALLAAYGVDRVGLDQAWRVSVGAPPLAATPTRNALPTAIPLPTIAPFTLDTAPVTAAPTPQQPAATGTAAPADTPASAPASGGGCTRAGAAAPADVSLLLLAALPLAALLRLRRRRG